MNLNLVRYGRHFIASVARRHLPQRGDKVVIAMSGGVDSSVTAALLAQKDYDLSAVFMRNWDTRDENGTDRGCEWEQDWEDVQRVCKVLDLPCDLVDLSQAYWNHVFQPSLDYWSDGLTPNPDVFCNREVKFGALMKSVPVRSSRWLATGHYARIGWSGDSPPRPKLLRAKDRTKDQTYYLSNISEGALQKTLFPIGDLLKSEVRGLALKYNLPTAQRAESMGICFVGKRKHFSGFIGQYIPSRPGDIVDLEGRKLARHQGIWSYTIGENARIPGMSKRMFVAKKDPVFNRIIVVDSPTHPSLMCHSVQVSDFRWIWRGTPAVGEGEPIAVSTQIRHAMRDTPATMEVVGAGCQIHFEALIQGVAPGQVAAVWQGDWCLGAGIITSTLCEMDLQ